MSNSGGGAATHGGIEFQQRVSAWFAVALLKGKDLAQDLELGAPFVSESLSWETSAAIDDLLLRAGSHSLLVQVKRSLNLSSGEDSEFRSVLDQFVSRFLVHPGESEHFVLIVSPRASQRIKDDLKKLLLSIRLNEAGYADNPRSKQEDKVLQDFRQEVADAFMALDSLPMTEERFVHFCKKVRVVVMDVEANAPHEQSALMMLGDIPRIGDSAPLVWPLVIAQCLRFGTGRLSCTRNALRSIVFASLERTSADIETQPEPETSDALRRPLKLFFSFTHADTPHRLALERHLSPLIRSGRIKLAYDRKIEIGAKWEPDVHLHLESADLILVLVSQGFLASNYCWDIELKRALERHELGQARVLPIFIEPCHWQDASFAHLQGLPSHGKALTEGPLEQGYAKVVQELATLIQGWELPAGPNPAAPGGFERDRYLRSLLARLEQLEDENLFSPDAYIELSKDITTPAVDPHPDFEGDEAHQVPAFARHLRRLIRRTRRSLIQLLSEPRTGRVLALLGEPGAGKSILMRRLARDLVQAALKNPQAPLPLYFSLGTYTQSRAGAPLPVEEFIQKFLANGPAPERALMPHVQESLATGRLILLFDGMDEMPRADFSARVAALRDFMQRQTLCRILVSCRTHDFPRSQLKVHQVRLSPLSPRQARTFLRRVLKVPWWSRGDLIHQVLAPQSPLAGLARNPLFLTLLGRYIVARGRLPESRAELFQGFVDPHLDRAVSLRPSAERIVLLESLGRLGLAMLDCSGVGTAVPVHQALAHARIDPEEGARWVDLAQLTGFVKRDVATGALRFLHPRLQEFFAALALTRAPPEEREEWLVANIDNPWLEEVYLLVAQAGADLSTFAEAVLDEADGHLSVAPGTVLRSAGVAAEFTDESRLILMGRMFEAARLPEDHPVVTRMAKLLARLEQEASKHPLPELRTRRLFRAVRGALVSHSQLAPRIEAALTSTEIWREEAAFKVLASRAADDTHAKRRLALHLLQQAVYRDLWLNSPRLRDYLADEPKLVEIRSLLGLSVFLHLGLIVGLTACWSIAAGFLVGAVPAFFSVVVSILFYFAQFSRRRHLPATPSALGSQFLVLTFHGAALLTWTGVALTALLFKWLFTETPLRAALMIQVLDFPGRSSTVMTCSVLVMFVAAFSRWLAAWLASPSKSLRWGVVAGLLGSTMGSLWEGFSPWLLAWVCATCACALYLHPRLSFKIRLPSPGTRRILTYILLGGLGTVAVAFAIGKTLAAYPGLLGHVFSATRAVHAKPLSRQTLVLQQALGWLLAIVPTLLTTWWVAKFCYSNISALLLVTRAPPGPFRLAQLSLALRVLISPLVMLEGRRAAIHRMGEMEPPSEALVIALLEYSHFGQGRADDRPEIAKAVDALQEKLRREFTHDIQCSLQNELSVLATIAKAWQGQDVLCRKVCQEWMKRLGLSLTDIEPLLQGDGTGQELAEVLRQLISSASPSKAGGTAS
ncbi:NACHT domain-containing protein [Corallococcus exiguus]|uniref:NACHT domain-containing protein n=1 Tax=Corallococcus exiguus TaxID=83462 RepID=UPI00147230A3|nr:NACHT domain-containing protein [Corallococcus exiguus]NNB86078.1 NACHT domain-containing protein [Corallococcus exiguus]